MPVQGVVMLLRFFASISEKPYFLSLSPPHEKNSWNSLKNLPGTSCKCKSLILWQLVPNKYLEYLELEIWSAHELLQLHCCCFLSWMPEEGMVGPRLLPWFVPLIGICWIIEGPGRERIMLPRSLEGVVEAEILKIFKYKLPGLC